MGEAIKPRFWTAFVVIVLLGVGLFFVPAFIIRPFKYQSPGALHTALVFRQFAPAGTIVVACAVLALAALLWNHARRLLKIAMVVGVLLVIGAAIMSRMNYFEWMFHPSF